MPALGHLDIWCSWEWTGRETTGKKLLRCSHVVLFPSTHRALHQICRSPGLGPKPSSGFTQPLLIWTQHPTFPSCMFPCSCVVSIPSCCPSCILMWAMPWWSPSWSGFSAGVEERSRNGEFHRSRNLNPTQHILSTQPGHIPRPTEKARGPLFKSIISASVS